MMGMQEGLLIDDLQFLKSIIFSSQNFASKLTTRIHDYCCSIGISAGSSTSESNPKAQSHRRRLRACSDEVSDPDLTTRGLSAI